MLFASLLATVDIDPRASGVLPVVLGVSFVLLASDVIYDGYRNGPGGD